jgi:hypothetical protein
MDMDTIDMRAHCLALAINAGATAGDAVDTAQRFYDFVTDTDVGNGSMPEPEVSPLDSGAVAADSGSNGPPPTHGNGS